ncbi:MAG: DJ-1/PfpI family protein [Kiritimatiellia bacterium]|jgi:4-methyl-5(b-hydroxyethyl)-thiazole monophosphate biosynthesis|nr:DJ-1/PfpI family protein [Kiritimatiellia bacterium]MDP6847348.1 DJ-1/PfpI family protein [Kiritimatiellia bacterium]
MARVLVPFADGLEEMEAVIIVDTLRRAGWDVVTASVSGKNVLASRGVRLVADALWGDIELETFDIIALPGGAGGTDVLAQHQGVLNAVRSFVGEGKLVGAICAGPLVLQAAGVTGQRSLTCHPGARDEMTTGILSNERVVVDEPIVTSQGPGTSFEFALKLIDLVDGNQAAERVAAGLVLP